MRLAAEGRGWPTESFREERQVKPMTHVLRKIVLLTMAAVFPGLDAAVAGESDLIFGLARLWEAHVDKSPLKTCVFRTVAEAQQWIDTVLNEAE